LEQKAEREREREEEREAVHPPGPQLSRAQALRYPNRKEQGKETTGGRDW
jgi:hypothetical protein